MKNFSDTIGKRTLLAQCLNQLRHRVSLAWIGNMHIFWRLSGLINLLTPNDDYSGHTAPLTSKCLHFIYLLNKYSY